MMTQETTVKGRMGKLQRLQARLASNRAELGHLEASLARFEAMITQVLDAADQQAFHTAGKQEASQQLQAALVEGERMATVLQLAVKQHYGIRSEKLADFGMKPFRGRNRKGTSEEKPKPPAVEPEPEPRRRGQLLRPASHLARGARSARPPFSCLLSPSPSAPEKSPSALSR